MKIRKLIAVAVVTVATIGFALPARAATTTTFTLTGGALSISDPASKNLGSAATGSATVSAQLGTVTVSDLRGATLGSWSASVSSTDFTTGGGTSNETIGKANVFYWSGAATANTGTAVLTPGQLLVANEVALSSSQTAFSAAATVGNNTAAWNPTVDVHVPAAAVAGTYSGTITHSVA
jgi:hypothetical protein